MCAWCDLLRGNSKIFSGDQNQFAVTRANFLKARWLRPPPPPHTHTHTYLKYLWTIFHCRELLEQIKDFEDAEFSGAKRDADFKISACKLTPLNEGGGTQLLQMVSYCQDMK